jgi:transposase
MTSRQKVYSEEFKKNIVALYKNGKTYKQIVDEYGISSSAISNWVRQYGEVKLSDDTVMTAKQIEQLQKKAAALEEENIILKKAAAIFMQHSNKD